jgi:hypothetical protein
MKVIWTKGLDPDKKKKFEQELKKAETVLATLDRILREKENKAREALKPDEIDAGWPHRAADNNGYTRALQEIRSIITKE